MYIISVNQKGVSLKRYESDILPMVGDIYPSSNFDDGYQRTVVSRILITDKDITNLILIDVDYSFPQLVNKAKDETQ